MTGRKHQFDLSDVIAGIEKQLQIEAHAVSGSIRHGGSKGRVRERSILDRLIAPYMPGNIRVSQNAEMASSDGQTSPEFDLVLHDSRVPPLLDAGICSGNLLALNLERYQIS